MTWGGKHNLTFAEYHTVPARWSAEGLEQQRLTLGGTYDIGYRGTPFAHQSMWYSLADGVRAGDLVCVELAVRFIEDRFICSYSGFARTKIARALKHAVLSREQQLRLSAHFLDLLERGDRTEEFAEYLRLWQKVVSDADRTRALKLADGLKAAAPEFHRRLALALTVNPAAGVDRSEDRRIAS